METKDFNIYANEFLTNIPTEKLNSILNKTFFEAGRNMGNDVDDELMDLLIDTTKKYHHKMPLYYVTSSIYKGSMGHYGAGRLIPRTIYGWLREMSHEYEREKEHKEIEQRFENKGTPVDLKKYPMGKAINVKVGWLASGAISDNDYDNIDIKELAEMIGQGKQPLPEDFKL